MEQLLQFFGGAGNIILFKVLLIVLMVFHLVFSFTIVRQVVRMTQVVEAQISPAIYTLSLVHLAASLLILIWTLLIV